MDLLHASGITVSFGRGVEWRYELRDDRWVELGFERGRLRAGPNVVTFDIVLAKMRNDAQREQARRIDAGRRRPQG